MNRNKRYLRLKMANRLDSQGLFALADQVDRRIVRTAASMGDARKVFNKIMTENGWSGTELVSGNTWEELNRQVAKHMGLKAGKDYKNWNQMIMEMQNSYIDPYSSMGGKGTGTLGDTPAERFRREQMKKGMGTARKEFNKIMTAKGWPDKELVLGNTWEELNRQVVKHMGLKAGKDYMNWDQMISAMRAADVAPYLSGDRLRRKNLGEEYFNSLKKKQPKPHTPPPSNPSKPSDPMSLGDTAKGFSDKLRQRYPDQVRPEQMAEDGKTATRKLRVKMANRLDMNGHHKLATVMDNLLSKKAAEEESSKLRYTSFPEGIGGSEEALSRLNAKVMDALNDYKVELWDVVDLEWTRREAEEIKNRLNNINIGVEILPGEVAQHGSDLHASQQEEYHE